MESTEEGHCFAPPPWDGKNAQYESTKPSILRINFNKIGNQSKIGTVGSDFVTLEQDSLSRYYEVGTMNYAFHYVLGHELIHLYHFLCDPKTYRKNISKLDTSYWTIYNDSRGHEANIWKNCEEQVTVLGTQSIVNPLEEFSEFALLIAGNVAPRYAYQARDRHYFYEQEDVIKKIFLDRLLTSETSFSELVRDNWEFSKTEALSSSLNPISLFEKTKNVREAANNEETLQMNKQIQPDPELEAKKKAMFEKLAKNKNLKK